MQIDPCLNSFFKLKSKWVKELYIKPDILNLTKKKICNSLESVGTGDHFQKGTSVA